MTMLTLLAWMPNLKTMATELDSEGIKVFNVTPGSAIDFFPFQDTLIETLYHVEE